MRKKDRVIRKRNQSRKKYEDRFIAFHASDFLYSYVTLYAFSAGISKSYVLRSMLMRWVDDNSSELSMDKLISNMTLDMRKKWQKTTMLTKKHQIPFDTFADKIRKELTKAKIKEDIIEKIIKGIK